MGRARGRLRGFLALPLVLQAILGADPLSGQQRPTLKPTDYDRWETLGDFALDPTGTWLVSSIERGDQTLELRLRRADGSGAPIVLEQGTRPEFSRDGRWLAYVRVPPPDAEEDSLPDRLALVNLTSASDTVLFPVESFAFRDDGAWLAARGRPAADSVGADLVVLNPTTGERTLIGNVDEFAWQDDGRLLAATLKTAWGTANGVILFDPGAGRLRTLESGDALYRELTWQEGSGQLGVLRSVTGKGREGETQDILVWADASAAAPPRVLLATAHQDMPDSLRVTPYAGLTFSDDGRTVFVGLRPWPPARAAADGPEGPPTAASGARGGGADGGAGSGAGRGGDRPARTDNPADSAAAADTDPDDIEPANVQVWHWNDDRILRAQEYNANDVAERTLAAAWHMDRDRLVMLADELDEEVTIVAGGRWAVVPDYDPYHVVRRFGADTADWFRVDVASGDRTLLAQAAPFGIETRPDGDRVLVYAGDQWSVLSLWSMERVVIGRGRSFTRALSDYDYPGPRPPWGLAAWVGEETASTAVLLYDKHDVWRADLSDGSLVRLTAGAEEGRRYRVVDLEAEASFGEPTVLAPDEPVWLAVRGLRSKASGYARLASAGPAAVAMARASDRASTASSAASSDGGRSPGALPPPVGEAETLILDDAQVGALTRARDAARYALRKERWDDSPDVFVGGTDLDDLRQLTRTNPFQGEYAWGRTELLEYTTAAGHDLQAILVYPAGFDEGREYPLILYQYERLSDGLHEYDIPSEREYYDYQSWSQQGYFVLMPDIVYEPGRPGPSALDAVEHALDAALATGHIDPERMGLIGHSWGGYQAAYLPTRTNRFAASVAGAPITNFLSFMGAIHWNGGLPETGHWETGQARMAVPYWQDLQGHLESSPANFIADLETPILLMHGDADGVVDFRQSLEFYNYGRRAGKQIALLVYPGADHGLRDETQQVDYHRRILQWFGHYLKGEPVAKWILEGETWGERQSRMGQGG